MTQEEIEAAQKEIDERIARDHANAAYEEEIRREVNESMPHISDLLPLENLKEEYKANKFEILYPLIVVADYNYCLFLKEYCQHKS